MKAYVKSITSKDTKELHLPIGGYIDEVIKTFNEKYLIKLDKRIKHCGWSADCNEITLNMKVPDDTKFWFVPKRDIRINSPLIMDTEYEIIFN